VFPCFGAPVLPEHSKLGQHGFARNEIWKFDSTVMDNDAGVSVRFGGLSLVWLEARGLLIILQSLKPTQGSLGCSRNPFLWLTL
jgi:hypothetical protein